MSSDDYSSIQKQQKNSFQFLMHPMQDEMHVFEKMVKYYPEHANFWMYAMIILGLAFIIFVALTIYKLCQPEKNTRMSNASTGNTPTTIVT